MSRWTWAIAALVAAAVAVGILVWRDDARERPDLSPTPIAVTLAGRPLAVPANTIRFVAQRRPGPRDRLDLALVAPELDGRTAANGPRFDTPGQPADVVWVTLETAHDGLDGAARLATIYARLFVGEPFDGPDGLVGRRLAAKAGYVGEEVWYEPGVVRPFVARCWPTIEGEETTTCLHDETIAGITVSWRFPKAMLGSWRALGAGLGARLAEWGLPTAP